MDASLTRKYHNISKGSPKTALFLFYSADANQYNRRMTTLPFVRLRKNADRRLRLGHPWIFSNEIETSITPFNQFTAGEEVLVQAHHQTILGVAYLNPHSLIAGRLFSRDAKQRLNKVFFQQCISTAQALRTQLFNQPYYRLIFGEADGLPGLIVDRFDDVLVVQINPAGMERKTPELLD
jgi:23S rRNA (cytosine1962-C5)-methyltransferase